MKKIITTLTLFSVFFISCKKERLSADSQNCKQPPPVKCATLRCNPDGKPVCGCNGITYTSACEAECDGVVSYTYGACKKLIQLNLFFNLNVTVGFFIFTTEIDKYDGTTTG